MAKVSKRNVAMGKYNKALINRRDRGTSGHKKKVGKGCTTKSRDKSRGVSCEKQLMVSYLAMRCSGHPKGH